MKPKFPPICVIDTNVPIVANDRGEFPDECVESCVEAIEEIMKNGNLVIDEGGEIFSEYMHKLNLSGQPGVGDAFLMWVHDYRWNDSKCEMVKINANNSSYNEFPQSEILRKFDRSDKKFIAVANAHPGKPPILEATDSKWWEFAEELKNFGIEIVFLCPEYVKASIKRKKGATKNGGSKTWRDV